MHWLTSLSNVGYTDLSFIVHWCCFLFWWMSYLQYDAVIDLIIKVGYDDIYFNIQLLCLISCRLYDFLDNDSEWCNLRTHGKCRSYWPLIHAPVFLLHFLKAIWWMNSILWDNWYVMQIWLHYKCRSYWPIFHGPVILLHNLKSISWMNIILWVSVWLQW